MRSLVIVYLMFHTTLLPSLCYKTKIQAYSTWRNALATQLKFAFCFWAFSICRQLYVDYIAFVISLLPFKTVIKHWSNTLGTKTCQFCAGMR